METKNKISKEQEINIYKEKDKYLIIINELKTQYFKDYEEITNKMEKEQGSKSFEDISEEDSKEYLKQIEEIKNKYNNELSKNIEKLEEIEELIFEHELSSDKKNSQLNKTILKMNV